MKYSESYLKSIGAIYAFSGRYRFLSNFYYSPIKLPLESGEIVEWRTVEHYYQAMKSDDYKVQEEFLWIEGPGQAKQKGKSIKLRDKWDDLKFLVMEIGVKKKFQTPHLANMLVNTEHRLLVEGNTWGDKVWGMSKSKTTGNYLGYNALGFILMNIRQKIREKELVSNDA